MRINTLLRRLSGKKPAVTPDVSQYGLDVLRATCRQLGVDERLLTCEAAAERVSLEIRDCPKKDPFLALAEYGATPVSLHTGLRSVTYSMFCVERSIHDSCGLTMALVTGSFSYDCGNGGVRVTDRFTGETYDNVSAGQVANIIANRIVRSSVNAAKFAKIRRKHLKMMEIEHEKLEAACESMTCKKRSAEQIQAKYQKKCYDECKNIMMAI